jgi:glycosyltransferase involved in cell wall biosynthesis
VRSQPGGTLALLVPAYNAASVLPRLMASVAAQTRPFDEVWVYDDASIDDTARTAEELGAKVVRGSINRGCSFGKDVLVRQTTCTWVHFHDADDELMPRFVEAAHRWMQRGEHDVVVFGCVQRNASTGEEEGSAIHSNAELEADPVRYTIRNKINSISGIYLRSAFLVAGGFDLDPAVLYNEDAAMHCSLARAGLRFAADPEILSINLRREMSMSGTNQIRCLRAQSEVLLKAMKHDKKAMYSKEISERLWEVATGAASYLDWQTADHCARHASELGGLPHQQSRLFRSLCRIEPTFALRVREGLIRLLKPQYRMRYQDGTASRREG